MATKTTAPRRRAPAAKAAPAPAAAAAAVDLTRRMAIEYIDITDITPYPYNPRDNEEAIPAVAASIKTFGFLVPCVIDENNVLVAGHTRTEAAKLLGMNEVPCIRATYLTPEQIDAFRLVDNKVSENAHWNTDLLSVEVSRLSDMGLDWTQFGWNQDEIDCLTDVVAADCLDAVQVAQEATANAEANSQRRAPTTARMVLGEIVFFLPATEYRAWADGIRSLNDFNEVDIVNDIKRRLGILT